MSNEPDRHPDQPGPDQPEVQRGKLEGLKEEALEAEAASREAVNDTFEQAGGVDPEPAGHAGPSEEEGAGPAGPRAAKLERLQKILAQAGVASRRHAEELIRQGRVQLNGKIITELGTKADPLHDHIRVDGKLLHGSERHRYFMLNKPKGFVTTVSDPEGRPTIMQFFAKMRERLYPVGRLDFMSEGLLLVTNDGELANKLTRAASGVEKTYLVKVSGQPSAEDLERLRQGVSIDRGKPNSSRVQTAPAEIRRFHPGKRSDQRSGGGGRRGPAARGGENPWFEVVLIEGRNRELRKMFEEIGHRVEKIRRVGYGPLVLDLEPGKFRELAEGEIEDLRKAAEGKLRRTKSRQPRERNATPRESRRAGDLASKPQRAHEGGRGKFRRESGRGFGPDRDRRPNHGQLRPDRVLKERSAKRPQGSDPSYGNPRARRPSPAADRLRADRGKFKRFGSGPPRPQPGVSREANPERLEGNRFRPGQDQRPRQTNSFGRNREDRPRSNKPRSEKSSRPDQEERGRQQGQSQSARQAGFKRGKRGAFAPKSGSMRSGAGRRSDTRPGGKRRP